MNDQRLIRGRHAAPAARIGVPSVCRRVNENACRVDKRACCAKYHVRRMNEFACRVAVNGYVCRVNESYEDATPQGSATRIGVLSVCHMNENACRMGVRVA